jgi:hypothetical protein
MVELELAARRHNDIDKPLFFLKAGNIIIVAARLAILVGKHKP